MRREVCVFFGGGIPVNIFVRPPEWCLCSFCRLVFSGTDPLSRMAGMRIATKLRWFTLTIVVLTALSVAMVGYFGNSAIIADLQREALKRRASLEVGRLQAAFAELERDIRFIRNLPMVDDIADASGAGDGAASVSRDRRDQLASIFEQLLREKPEFAQIRLIGAANDGLELVRVDRDDRGISRVPDERLRPVGHREYFTEAIGSAPGELFYSSTPPKQEFGAVQPPAGPMLRVAMPVHDSRGGAFGVVVVNLAFRPFLGALLDGAPGRGRYTYYLLDQYGEFLVHPDATQSFGFDLDSGLKASDGFENIGEFLQGGSETAMFRSDSISEHGGSWVHFTKFRVFNPSRELIFGIVASYGDVGRASWTITLAIVSAIGLLILIALLVTVCFSAKLTRPLERIMLAARSFANNTATGEADGLPTGRQDEIGDLAHTFQEMKAAVERHQGNLESANRRLAAMHRDLEHFASVASHDLREPIQRIAGLASLFHVEFANESDEEARQILEQLNSECENALRQLADFREFTQITGDASLAREETSIEAVIRSVLEEFAEPLAQRGVVVEVDANMPSLEVYKNLVRSLYRNLVENTLIHAKKDGFKLHFTCEQGDGAIICGVKNSDSRIEAKYFDAVFDIFRKLEDGSGRNGVGLAICKRVVDFHKGSIWVESTEAFVHVKFTLSKQL